MKLPVDLNEPLRPKFRWAELIGGIAVMGCFVVLMSIILLGW